MYMYPELTREELSNCLETITDELLRPAGITRPPVDAFELAARLGLHVATDSHQASRARYVRARSSADRPPLPTILLRPEPRPERRHWAVAHEIGEHLAARVFARLGVDARTVSAGSREWAANALASRLLLPGRWFERRARRCGWDLFELKRAFSTASHELVARRMLDFDPPVIISVFDQGRLQSRWTNAAWRVPPPSPGELECFTRVHSSGQPMCLRRGGLVLQGWPIHEEGWKREILRLEIDDAEVT
jgi:Zn-dependent peptidase ImmA (M78 family)